MDHDETIIITLPEPPGMVTVALPREYLALAELQMRKHALVLEVTDDGQDDGKPTFRARPTHYALCEIVADDRKRHILRCVVFGLTVTSFLVASILRYDVMAATLISCSIFGGAAIIAEHPAIALRRKLHDKLRDAGI